MLEIIYDARLIQLPEDFMFFGAELNQWGCTMSFHDFNRRYFCGDGGTVIEHGASIGHYYGGEANGTPNQAGSGRIEFIVPFDAESVSYIEEILRDDGMRLCGKWFETRHTLLTAPNKTAYCHSFKIPPCHFYFLGEHNVV